MSFARSCAALAFGAVCSFGGDAHADNPFGWHEHDRFYLRAATGLGPMLVSRRTTAGGTETSPLFVGDNSSMSGLTGGLEIAAGATPFEGIVIAGTILLYELPNAEVRLADDTTVPLKTTFDLMIVAPTVDIFPRKSGGFHVGGGFGYADGTATVQQAPGIVGGKGLGLTASSGYGWWIEDDWSVGAMARVTFAFTAGHHASGDATGSEKDMVSVFTLGITGLFH